MSLQEIQLIPEGRFKGKFKGRKVVVSGWYDGYKWNNTARSLMYKRVKAIIRGSVGEKWDDIYSKLVHLTKNEPFRFELDYWTTDVVRPYWNTKEEKWYVQQRYGNHFDLYAAIKNIKGVGKYQRDYSPIYYELYWICPYTGRLMYVKSKPRPPLTKEEIRVIYEKRAQRRKRNKEYRIERRLRGIPQLAMINRPDLYGFYNQLISKYKGLEKELWSERSSSPPKFEKFERYYSIKLKKMVNKPIPDAKARYLKKLQLWRDMNVWRKQRLDDIRQQMDRLKPQIEALERGEFNIFFENNVYLYSIQKECHHFESP